MRHAIVLLRSLIAVVVCLALAPWAKALPLTRAQRYPDSMVASVWAPDGQRWIRLEQVAPGHYRGSVEFESGGWMTAYEYYEFTCQLTLGDREAPLRFHHEFRVASGEAAEPSELWAVLTYDWDVGAFLQTEDFAAVFDAPASEENQELGPVVGPVAGGLAGIARTSTASSAATPLPAGPILAFAGASSSGATGNAGAYDPFYGPSVYGKDGYDYNGYDRDGYDRMGRDHDGYDRSGYDCSGYDRGGLDRAGYDRNGYDRDGYDADGYDRNGVDRQGFNRQGVFQGDFDAEGYDSTGYDRDGFDREGYDHNGRNREGYDREGFDAKGYTRYDGYLYGTDGRSVTPPVPADGVYDADGYDAAGYDRQGFDRAGVYRDAAPPALEPEPPRYDARGFDGATGLNVNGTYYDDLGYDIFGYDSAGFDSEGFDRDGFDQEGRNRLGVDTQGYDRDGYNVRGFNRDGIHRNRTLYDDDGFDRQGYDRQGRYYGDYDINAPGKPQPPTVPEKPAPVPAAPVAPPGYQAMADLLDDEGFPSRLEHMSDRDLAGLIAQYGSIDKISPEEYAALERSFFDHSLTMLWHDLDRRIAEAEFGLNDEDPEELRLKQVQIEEYLLGVPSAGSSAGPMRVAAAVPDRPPAVSARTDRAQSLGPDHDNWKTATLAFAESFVLGAAVAVAVAVAAPVVIAAGATALAAAGMSAATISVTGALLEGGVIAYAAYDTGKTAVAVKEDLDAGRLDAAAAKAGGTLGAIVGGVGANKIIGSEVAAAAGEASGTAAEMAAAQETAAGAAKEASGVGAAGEATGKAMVSEAAGAGAGKAVLAAEDCNGAGIKRLFESLPKKNRRVAHVETETEIVEIWSQLKKTGAPIKEEPNGSLVMTLSDETKVTYYKSKTDTTTTIQFKVPNEKSIIKIHLKAQ